MMVFAIGNRLFFLFLLCIWTNPHFKTTNILTNLFYVLWRSFVFSIILISLTYLCDLFFIERSFNGRSSRRYNGGNAVLHLLIDIYGSSLYHHDSALSLISSSFCFRQVSDFTTSLFIP